MELDDPGFHHSVLADFRERLAQDDRARAPLFRGRLDRRLARPPAELRHRGRPGLIGLLPQGAPVVAMVESNPDAVPVPSGASRGEIQELLDTLLEAE
ncbi:hypothetical protein [Kitasatospora sp. HPMI-4]|uniref:hypothetical protein n=1 Tax=Kitasatospora sp. HPMI-4 TaxID=3448443 RepID=UPI003F1ADB04